MNEAKYILGIDWGKRRCGIAYADTETLIATGYGECDKQNLVQELKKIAEEMKIQEIIVGFSFVLGEDKHNVKIQDVIDQLESLGFKVRMEEEMFSTKMAQKHLAEAQKKQISKNDNIESARIILQSRIDKLK